MVPRVAFLILAHHQPRHVARLAAALAHPDAQVFLHVDAKSDLGPFREALAGVDVTVVERRLPVFWGGFSIVAATLLLLDEAVRAGDFARFCLLSDADFPLKPPGEIVRRLLASDREFLRVAESLASGGGRAAVERRHFNDTALLNPRRMAGGGMRRRARRLARSAVGIANAVLPRRVFPAGLVPYKGSQWWSLTGACVAYVRDFVRRNPEYVRFHRHVHCPDEIFFHSLVKASPFAERISHDLGRPIDDGVRGVHYVVWKSGAPTVLRERDFPALAMSSALFARKFVEPRSDGLRERIATELLQAPAPAFASPGV